MRKTFHFSWASHNEALCRSVRDLNRLFNCYAESVVENDARALADSEMTTHCHFATCAEDVQSVVSRTRYKYTRYFNSQYGRTGRLGEDEPFICELDGIRHIQTCLSYIFRQGLHHGLSTTPYGYAHNSVNTVFRAELGKEFPRQTLQACHRSKFLSYGVRLPPKYRMDENGLLFREDVIDTGYVEEIYVSPKNFLFQMARLSGEEWVREQLAENGDTAPVTLDLIERGVSSEAVAVMLKNERAYVDKSRMTDLELCRLIDEDIVPSLGRESIYGLGYNERRTLAEDLWRKAGKGVLKRMAESQIRRCLIL